MPTPNRPGRSDHEKGGKVVPENIRPRPGPCRRPRRQRVLALFDAGMKPKQILEPVRADFGDHVSLAVVYNDIKWLRAEGAVAKPDGREASTGGSDALGSRDQGPILARRRERVRALFEEGMKPRQIAEHVRREFGANLRITLVYRDITWAAGQWHDREVRWRWPCPPMPGAEASWQKLWCDCRGTGYQSQCGVRKDPPSAAGKDGAITRCRRSPQRTAGGKQSAAAPLASKATPC